MRVILQRGVIEAGKDADADETPVRQVDGRKRADVVPLVSTDAMDAIRRCERQWSRRCGRQWEEEDVP